MTRLTYDIAWCILIVLVTYFPAFSKIIIKERNVATLTRGDIGMIFYMTIGNSGGEQYRIYVRMLQCCEEITKRDIDCGFMYLLGGDMGILEANKTKNITLLYPNMYLHNRVGTCRVSIIYLNQQEQAFETKATIQFNTTVGKSTIPPIMRDYYVKKEVSVCYSNDLDPLDGCQPVNCHVKYLGMRNYYNHHQNRCEQVTPCIADPHKDMPDVAYVPISNRCRNLEDAVGVNDLQFLVKGTLPCSWNEKNSPVSGSNFRCHHGTKDNQTGFCVCDPGWMSVPFDKSQYEPSLSMYHMCNIQVGTWNSLNSDRIKMTLLVIGLVAVCVAMAVLIFAFLLNILYKFLKSMSKPRPDMESVCHCRRFPGATTVNEKDPSKPKGGIAGFFCTYLPGRDFTKTKIVRQVTKRKFNMDTNLDSAGSSCMGRREIIETDEVQEVLRTRCSRFFDDSRPPVMEEDDDEEPADENDDSVLSDNDIP